MAEVSEAPSPKQGWLSDQIIINMSLLMIFLVFDYLIFQYLYKYL